MLSSLAAAENPHAVYQKDPPRQLKHALRSNRCEIIFYHIVQRHRCDHIFYKQPQQILHLCLRATDIVHLGGTGGSTFSVERYRHAICLHWCNITGAPCQRVLGEANASVSLFHFRSFCLLLHLHFPHIKQDYSFMTVTVLNHGIRILYSLENAKNASFIYLHKNLFIIITNDFYT